MSDIRQSPELTINRVPTGLSGLIDTKSQGTGPFAMDSRIQGAVMMNHFYEQPQAWQGYGASYAVSATGIFSESQPAGSYNSSKVPAGELWRLVGASYQAANALAAATTMRLSLMAQCQRSGLTTYVGLTAPQSFTTGDKPFDGWTGELWLAENDSLAVFCSSIALGTSLSMRLGFAAYKYRL